LLRSSFLSKRSSFALPCLLQLTLQALQLLLQPRHLTQLPLQALPVSLRSR
jgi:hypothetical protein